MFLTKIILDFSWSKQNQSFFETESRYLLMPFDPFSSGFFWYESELGRVIFINMIHECGER